jgi:hypothetical protein
MKDQNKNKPEVKEKVKSDPYHHEGLISDEEIRIANQKIHGGIKGDEMDDNEEEGSLNKGFEKSVND